MNGRPRCAVLGKWLNYVIAKPRDRLAIDLEAIQSRPGGRAGAGATAPSGGSCVSGEAAAAPGASASGAATSAAMMGPVSVRLKWCVRRILASSLRAPCGPSDRSVAAISTASLGSRPAYSTRDASDHLDAA